jgi:hypothetical protein
MEQRKQQSVVASEEQAKKELDGLTFQPEISEKSRAMCSGRPVWQRLGSTAPSSSAARKRAAHKAEAEKGLEECTFRPKVREQSKCIQVKMDAFTVSASAACVQPARMQINNRSSSMMSHKHALLQQQNVSAHESLYRDAQLRADKLETKKREVYSCDSSLQHFGNCVARSGLKERPVSSCTASHDIKSAQSMPAGDRLYAYHLKKEVQPRRW